jgi:hypothetical protein
MNRQKVLRRVAAAAVVGVAATVLTLGSASPALAKDGECEAYREMTRLSWGQFYDHKSNPWWWLGEDLLHTARALSAAEHWFEQSIDSCY